MIGEKLLHFELTGQLGKGGMGEVYRARDLKLGREVAIKILPTEMSGDPERLARFDREARLLASLQHPNIAAIHGFERDRNIRFLVMELAEGEDLSERLARGRLSVEESMEIARQLAEGLEAAHAQGIIHRDLKPANVKIGSDGRVKILDFGLARAYAGDPMSGYDVDRSPTITAAATHAGVILGTAAYMSPEQARGQAVDQRSDLWAFGVILFEMLAGRRLFAGETVSDTLAAVLRADPPWEQLPPETRPNVHRLLHRCLERDPKRRLRSAGDAGLELLDAEPLPLTAPDARRSHLMPAALALLAVAVVVAAWLASARGGTGQAGEPTHLSLALPDGLQVASRDMLPLGAPQPCLAVSDDGRAIVVVVERGGTTLLYRRFLDEPDGELLEDTAGGYFPRISPNGEWISFMAGNTLKKIAIRGDRATSLLDLPNSFGHDWINDAEIVINRGEARELLRVDVERGTYSEYERETEADEFFWPRRVPGADAILFNSDSHVAKSEEADVDLIGLLDLVTGKRTEVGIGGSMPQLLPGGPLLVVRDGVLMAAPFDLDDPAAGVRPVTVLEGLLVEGWIGQYAVSPRGTVVYVPGKWLLGNELVWDDGRGSVEPLGFPLLAYGDFELSPEGRRLAITVGGGRDSKSWIYDLERGARRLLTTGHQGDGAIWSPDGARVAFASARGESVGIYIRTVGSNAPATLLLEVEDGWLSPYAWHDRVGMLYNQNWDIYVVDPDDPEKRRPLVATPASEWGPDISPDGRWFAYTSDESGRYEVYARAIDGERSWNVSLDGGEEPLFSEDGKTLYYRYGNQFFATPILEASADGTLFRAGKPVVVVEGAYSNVPGLSYDVHPDGRMLLLRTDGGTERPGFVNVILNWNVELERRMGDAR